MGDDMLLLEEIVLQEKSRIENMMSMYEAELLSLPHGVLVKKNINGKEDVYTEYAQLKGGTLEYDAFLEKYEFTHLIVAENTLFDMYLSLNEGYKECVDGNGYVLYETLE